MDHTNLGYKETIPIWDYKELDIHTGLDTSGLYTVRQIEGNGPYQSGLYTLQQTWVLGYKLL